jgi:hypothetical protein
VSIEATHDGIITRVGVNISRGNTEYGSIRRQYRRYMLCFAKSYHVVVVGQPGGASWSRWTDIPGAGFSCKDTHQPPACFGILNHPMYGGGMMRYVQHSTALLAGPYRHIFIL